jgi:hypothetical protein
MPTKNKEYTEQQLKELKILQATNEMHERTKKETKMMGKPDAVKRIELSQNDVIDQMAAISPEFAAAERKKIKDGENDNDSLNSFFLQDNTKDTIFDVLNLPDSSETIDAETEEIPEKEEEVEEIIDDDAETVEEDEENNVESEDKEVEDEENVNDTEEDNSENAFNDIDPTAEYDIIPLPSKGEPYKKKIGKIPVGYLTAYDENFITSPNLYESGLITDILIKNKVLTKDVNADDFVSGDVDAIMLFLRATSYGSEFPITAYDPQTGKKIETTVDLSTIKMKNFTLKGDENGYFDFTLPLTKHAIKFKFLTKKDEKQLEKLATKENEGITAFDIDIALKNIRKALENDANLSKKDRQLIMENNKTLEGWYKRLSGTKGTAPYSKSVTNNMEMEIISVDGNKDRKYIHDFVLSMPAKDSLAFRRFVFDNKPGMDFEVEVERPESLGGGSFKCFLEWDDYVFWHIA